MKALDTTVPIEYAALFDNTVTEIIEPSGRCSAKTTSNEILAVSLMCSGRANNIWYCRAEKGDIRETVFSSLIVTIQLMGLETFFKWSLSPFVVTCTLTGARCYFSGINGKTDDDMTATKGFTPQGGTLALCILDEADQVKHYNHITAWESTANRFLLPHGKMIYAYNPPMTRSHWAYQYFGDKVKNGATRIYATWENIRTLLPVKTIQQIEKFRRDDPEYYRYWYLGEPVNFKGMVYPQFNREKQVIDVYRFFAERDIITELVIGVDEGTAFDSTCATALAIFRSGRAVVLDCFELDPVESGQKAPTEASRALYQWLCRFLNTFDFVRNVARRWIFECAEGGQMLMLQFEHDFHEPCQKVTNKSIMGDIKRVRSMLSDGVLFFYSVPGRNTTEKLLQDIEGYVFDEKTGMPKKQQRDDTIDSLEYATKLYYDVPLMVA